MASTSRTNIIDLPNEIMVSIFSFLPVTDLARCAATCEQWHRIVTGFSLLWKGKRYQSIRSPTECTETRAVLHALAPLQQVVIERDDGFYLKIFYPNMTLALRYIRVLDDCPRLRCEYLTTRLDIAGHMLSHRSTIDFDSLRHLRIQQTFCEDIPLAEYLDMVEGFSQLRTLEIEYHGLQKLSFLRHCSGTLEELKLVNCTSLPSRELANLSRLRKLRNLSLSRCYFEESDLATAVAGLANLEVLELHRCGEISNLSFLQNCIRMQKLYINNSAVLNALPMDTEGGLWMHDLRLPSAFYVTTRPADTFTLTAVSLPAALSRLEKMGLSSSCLDYLGALRNCTDLIYICCEFARVPHMGKVRVHIILRRST